MATPSLMSEGLTLMLFGMGSVFVFLTLLVIFTTLMSYVLEKYDAKYNSYDVDPDSTSNTNSMDQASLLAVLTSAVHQYRSKRK